MIDRIDSFHLLVIESSLLLSSTNSSLRIAPHLRADADAFLISGTAELDKTVLTGFCSVLAMSWLGEKGKTFVNEGGQEWGLRRFHNIWTIHSLTLDHCGRAFS